ncbi:hypothetical protein AMJ71_04540 [candidate division TA06 bacterium SM1_40]|uniref:Uncharacterized protein n=2 Tax=Bacteria division TA06 TaxID=1156500 RepID=A0A0S8JKA8_UNCT6|nr:MAG: hypothetical protein AMJ82_07675 [candidate division TA06 bacterium SM23_40]KPL10058.1 MAG: hypothetical protein AMJ71_04540 [candidate division TA06 bacterium SM1_40]
MRLRLRQKRLRSGQGVPLSEAEQYRASVREELYRELDKERERQQEAGRYPYKGTWKRREEVLRLQRSSRVMHIELTFLMLLGFLFGLFVIWRFFKLARAILFP